MIKRKGHYKHRDEETRKNYYSDQKELVAILPPSCCRLRPTDNVYGTIIWVDDADGKETPVICMCGGSMYLDYRCAQNILYTQQLIDKLLQCQDSLEKAEPYLFNAPLEGALVAHKAVEDTLTMLKEGDES